MATKVTGQVGTVNGYSYMDCSKTISLSCETLETRGTVWLVPTGGVGGAFGGYRERRSSTKPTPTSVKAVKVLDTKTGSYYNFLLNDADSERLIADNCNLCCGTVPVLPSVIIPTPIIEDVACEVPAEPVDGPFQIFAVAPPLGAGQKYYPLASKDGVLLTPAPAVAGYTTVAAVQTFAAANWSAAGTWTASGQELALTNNTPFRGDVEVYALTQLSANAGSAQTLSAGATTATLNGTATAGATSYSWARTGGTGSASGVAITNPTSVTTGVTGLTAGTHIFTLTAKNQAGTASTSTVTITAS